MCTHNTKSVVFFEFLQSVPDLHLAAIDDIVDS